jgi:hypothetical protein
MCYSKEVQLITSLIIILSTVGYYLYYYKKYRSFQKEWPFSFLKRVALVFLCGGIHQFFEYLSLITNQVIVYKIGLIVSIFAVYFLVSSLEVLVNAKFYSELVFGIIFLVALQIFFSPMTFSSKSFYLEHHSAFIWSSVWLFLFFYWNTCAIRCYCQLKLYNSKRTMILYLLALTDVSFLISLIYVLLGHFIFSVNVCTDSPSIWCTFFVIQAFLLPLFLSRIPVFFERKSQLQKIPFKKILACFALSLAVLILLVLFLPLFHCFSWKLVFP